MGNLRILTFSDEPFADRVDAGAALADELRPLCGAGAVVLGIPRGGVVVARELADALEAELDVVLTRKLGAPGNPELAMGAITETGRMFINKDVARMTGASEAYIEQARAEAMAELARRAAAYRPNRPRAKLDGRPVIVTDDGVATGSTMQAALWSLRNERPSRLICALPVAPEDTAHRLAADADELVCLRAPPYFHAVGQFYRDFSQTTDEEVIALLARQAAGSKAT